MFDICFPWRADRLSVPSSLGLTESHKCVWMSYVQCGRKLLHIKHEEKKKDKLLLTGGRSEKTESGSEARSESRPLMED